MPSCSSAKQRMDPLAVRIDPNVAWRSRSRIYAGLLGIFFGAFGAHRYYLGYKRLACVQIAVTILTGGIGGLWGTFEGWSILLGKLGFDAAGHRLGHQATLRVLAGLTGAAALHTGAVAGVFLLDRTMARLYPPPEGTHSINITASMPTTESPPVEIRITVSPTCNDTDTETRPTHAEPPPLEKQMLASALSHRDQPLATLIPFGLEPVPLQNVVQQREDVRPHVPDPNQTIHRSSARADPKPRQLAIDASAATIASPVSTREQSGVQADALPVSSFSPEPEYPPALRNRRIEGLVKLRVHVGADGRVLRASIYRTSGYSGFDQAALAVIDRWRFEPARRAGIAVEMEIAVPVRFVIDDKP